MDNDYRELAHRLFAAATAMLEDAIGAAVAGQSSRLNPSQLADNGRRLQAATHDIAIIAEAATIVAILGVNRRRNRRKRRCRKSWTSVAKEALLGIDMARGRLRPTARPDPP